MSVYLVGIEVVHPCIPLHKFRGQSTLCKSQFSLSTMRGPEMEAQVVREQSLHKTRTETEKKLLLPPFQVTWSQCSEVGCAPFASLCGILCL